ncbi:hypothetical protein ACLB2K_045439 [Fragaria x ananassa]
MTNSASGSGKHDEPTKPPPPKDSKKKDEDLSDEDLALKQQLVRGEGSRFWTTESCARGRKFVPQLVP